jgi:hypothetical protein
MLPANGAGVAHRVSGADAREIDQLGGRVNFLATTKIKPPQVIHAELIGSDTCTALGIASRSSAPVLAMCRALVDAGHNSSSRLDAYRGDVLCLRVRSIGEGARLEVAEGIGFRPYRKASPAPLAVPKTPGRIQGPGRIGRASGQRERKAVSP